MIRLRHSKKWLALIWLAYATVFGIFMFFPPTFLLPPANPDGMGIGGALAVEGMLLLLLSYGLWKHRVS